MNRGKTVVVVLLIIFCSVALLLSLFLIFFLFFRVNSDVIENTTSYQYQEIFRGKKTKNGFVTLGKRLEKDEFISYQNSEEGSTVVISEFTNSQYQCTGSCVCEEPSRRSSTVVSRGLVILFAALSTSLATEIATRTFHDQCVAQFAETCDDVEAEVDSCSEAEEATGEEAKENSGKYTCDGHCRPTRFDSEKLLLIQEEYLEEVMRGDCKDLVLKKQVTLDQSRLSDPKVNPHYEAGNKFRKTELDPFCQESTRVLVSSKHAKTEKHQSMCSGKRPRGEDNVKCVSD